MNDNLLLDRPTAGLGHNNPPEPTLEEELEVGFAPLADRVATVAALANALPKVIADDDALGQAADIGKQARKLVADIERDRKAKKEPYLEAGRLVDSYYATPRERVERIASTIEGRASDYQRQMAAEARRKAEEEARKAREEEQRRAEAAQKAAEAGRAAHASVHEVKADEAAEVALRAEAQARQSTADLTRVRSASGTVATARTTMVGEIVDLAQLDLEALRPYLTRDMLQTAVNGWVRANAKGAAVAPTLRGARVFEQSKAVFR